jgi:hypothetical protein
MVYLVVGCASLIGTVFAVSTFSKLHSRRALTEFLYSTTTMLYAFPRAQRVNRTFARSVGFAVIAAELGTFILVVIPATVPIGFGVAFVLLLGFSLAIAVTSRSGVSVSCRCFGASSSPVGGRHLLRNSLLLVATISGLVASVAGRQGPATPAGVAIAAGTAVVAAVLLIRFDDLFELFRPSTIGTRAH